jgi:hypothetical protein
LIHEKVQTKSKRITVPLRVSKGQEIMANGLGNTFSKEIIDNSISNSAGIWSNLKKLLKCYLKR